jgi:hypothetical protein
MYKLYYLKLNVTRKPLLIAVGTLYLYRLFYFFRSMYGVLYLDKALLVWPYLKESWIVNFIRIFYENTSYHSFKCPTRMVTGFNRIMIQSMSQNQLWNGSVKTTSITGQHQLKVLTVIQLKIYGIK